MTKEGQQREEYVVRRVRGERGGGKFMGGEGMERSRERAGGKAGGGGAEDRRGRGQGMKGVILLLLTQSRAHGVQGVCY